jgi:SH3 domain-containing protein
VVWDECDYFSAQCVALVEEPESEFESHSHSEAGPHVIVIEEPDSEAELKLKPVFAPGVGKGIVAVASYKCVKSPFLVGSSASNLGLLARRYNTREDNELSFREGIWITHIKDAGYWWYGRHQYGNDGLFPGACICCA